MYTYFFGKSIKQFEQEEYGVIALLRAALLILAFLCAIIAVTIT